MGWIHRIQIAASPSSPIREVEEIRAIPGLGLEGDRYHVGSGTFSPNPRRPDFELTLIELEAVEAASRETGLPLTPADTRRNLVTQGVRLNDLVGHEFTVGSVRVKGIRLCEPCNYLAKITFPEILKALVHRGGLRAQILTEGVIRLRDAITVED